MRKSALYSGSHRRAAPADGDSLAAAGASAPAAAPRPWRAFYARHRISLFLAATTLVLLSAVAALALRPAPPALSEDAVNAAVERALEGRTLPSPAAKAYEAVRASLVYVRAGSDALEADGRAHRAAGSGVVVVDTGLILTSLHVVAEARRITVVFANGQESEARIVRRQPENDLAVIQATVLPDDLKPATLGSSSSLVEGDDVVAVGFPFGIGPSVSAGVVSGLGREYRSPAGDRILSDLIQFDAAANPGSSGGPLVNAAGEVVGIVSAILSPGEHGTFAGIAFAVPIQTAAAAAGLPPF